MTKHRGPYRHTEPEIPTTRTVNHVARVADTYGFGQLESQFNLHDRMLESICIFESKGNHNARSTKDCAGLLQVSVDAGKMMGVVPKALGDEESIRYLQANPGRNAFAGAKYLRYIARDLDNYNKELQAQVPPQGLSFSILDEKGQITDQGVGLVLAAYNCGPGRMHSRIRKFGDNWYDHVPIETHNYVLNIMTQMDLTPPKLSALGAKAQHEAPGTPEDAKRIEQQIAKLEKAPDFERALKDNHWVVGRWQNELKNGGFKPGNIDETVGTITMGAHGRWETANGHLPGVTVDGHVSAAELRIALKPAQTPPLAGGPQKQR